MSTLVDLRLTPETISNRTYRIPLYQRLFEWDSERITQLLNDLKEQPADKAYYVGMLTSTAKNDLVDGQQRFTVMMLMGIALSIIIPLGIILFCIMAILGFLFLQDRMIKNTFLF